MTTCPQYNELEGASCALPQKPIKIWFSGVLQQMPETTPEKELLKEYFDEWEKSDVMMTINMTT